MNNPMVSLHVAAVKELQYETMQLLVVASLFSLNRFGHTCTFTNAMRQEA